MRFKALVCFTNTKINIAKRRPLLYMVCKNPNTHLMATILARLQIYIRYIKEHCKPTKSFDVTFRQVVARLTCSARLSQTQHDEDRIFLLHFLFGFAFQYLTLSPASLLSSLSLFNCLYLPVVPFSISTLAFILLCLSRVYPPDWHLSVVSHPLRSGGDDLKCASASFAVPVMICGTPVVALWLCCVIMRLVLSCRLCFGFFSL